MTFQYPLVVQVSPTTLSSGDVQGLLLELSITHSSRYYYGTIFGLTDSDGRASISPIELRAHFQLDRELFPMDYKVPLEACDSTATVSLLGGKAFETVLQQALDSTLVDPPLRQLWRDARNGFATNAKIQVNLADLKPGSVILLERASA